MSREKRSRSRWNLRPGNSRAGGSTIEQLEYSHYSFENEATDQPKSSSTPLKGNRALSGSINNTQTTQRKDSKEISDKSENEVDSDNLTYTKHDSESNKKDVESPVSSVRKVEDYLMRHEKPESDSPDNNEVSRDTRRKSEERCLEFDRTEDEEMYAEDGRSSERRESESPENNNERREKRRKSKKERKEKARVLESKGNEDEDMYNENGRSTERRESESPDNNNERREKRRKSKKERKAKARILKSKKSEDEEMYDENGQSAEKRESESPENNNLRRENRRKSKKERKEKARVLKSQKSEDEEMYDEDGQSAEKRESLENNNLRREKRRKSKKERSEKARLLESSRTVEDDAYDDDVRPKSKKSHRHEPRISRRRKRRRSRADSSGRGTKEEKELPITEILRKAQENSRNRYEEPVPLTELTTDTIYVQRRNGFSAVKISGDRNARGRRHSQSPGTTVYPIKVAIAAQKVWNGTGLINQGLLAGMALMHILLIQKFFELSLDFLVDYSFISEVYTNVFSFLVTMCVVSVFDKFDLAHLDLEHLREIYVDHSRSFLAVPLYLATFCLHQASLLVDDKISLLNYTGNATGFEYNSTETIVEEQLITWQKMTLAKDGLAVIAWLFVALGPREDMLLTHLKTMEKYTDSPDESRREIVEIIRGNLENG